MVKKEKSAVDSGGLTRRDFLKGSASSAILLTAGLDVIQRGAWAAGSDTIRVGLIGCGGRGSGAVRDCINAAPGVKVVALGDLFQDRLDTCYNGLVGDAGLKEKVDLSKDRCFCGWDSYQKVIDSGVDLVILATPPGFRPMHFEAAIKAGKHVFMEKPVSVDAPGTRLVMEMGKLADQKKLGVVAGTQRRHEAKYIEMMKRVHEGQLGELVGGQCYWNQGGLWNNGRKPEWSDMEWQIRNWLYFTWLSGDHIVEQHVHNIDVMNWAFEGHPVKARGMGGRQVRTDPAYGHIFDHFAVEFVYPNGARILSMCRQIDGCWGDVSERIVGTKGVLETGPAMIKGVTNWKYEGPNPGPYQQEHADLINSIRSGKPINETQRIAESCLTAIMGRMSAYTGTEITWDQALESKENLMPTKLEFGPLPVPPVAVPGKTKFI